MGRAFDSVTVVALCTLLSTLSTSAHAQSTAAAETSRLATDATDSSTAPGPSALSQPHRCGAVSERSAADPG